jgi:hypothetical protein
VNRFDAGAGGASRASADACRSRAQDEAAGGQEAVCRPARRRPVDLATPRAAFGIRLLIIVGRILKIPTKANDHLNCIRLSPFSYISNIYALSIQLQREETVKF